MTERTTIVGPDPLKQRAVARAREQGISFGEFVRRAVENMLSAPPRGDNRKKIGDPFWDNLEIYDGGHRMRPLVTMIISTMRSLDLC